MESRELENVKETGSLSSKLIDRSYSYVDKESFIFLF